MLEVSRKAFKIKRIQQLPPADTSTKTEPFLDRPSTAPEPALDRIYTNFKGGLIQLLLPIIKEGNGITAGEINNELRKVIKRKKFYNPPDLSTTGYISSHLKLLVDRGILVRVKINKVYHYYLRVD